MKKPPPAEPSPATRSDVAPDRANVPIFPPVLPLSGLVLGIILERLFPIGHMTTWLSWPRLTLAALFLVPGAVIFAGSGRAMRRAGTHVNPSQPSLHLVQAWPFSLSRNPMYLGGNLLYLGLALAFHLSWMLLLFPLIAVLCHYLVVRREEEYLAKKFGADYLDYQRRVHRWL